MAAWSRSRHPAPISAPASSRARASIMRRRSSMPRSDRGLLRAAPALVLATACGRVGFEPTSGSLDGGVPHDMFLAGGFKHVTTLAAGSCATSFAIPLTQPVAAGTTIVARIALRDPGTGLPTAIDDAGNA